ncbi:virulence RhuM family protein [Capnocytophaga gingivalis]
MVNRQINPMDSQFLIYQNQEGDIKIDVRFQDETIWLSLDQMATLFSRDKSTISRHIKNIFEEGELYRNSVVANFATTATDGKNYQVEYYNLDVIISVGYRVKSQQGTRFRIWATQQLKEYLIKGFVLNDERFKQGSAMNYFHQLQERLREIRISERFFYQKIKDIYKTSIDYNPQDEQTIIFFKIVQNKLLWAVSQQIAAEIVYNRTNASLPFLGMQSYDKTATATIKKSEVSIAKNYLNEEEVKLLGLLVEQYLAFAETMAQQQTPMYMKDWIARFDIILQLNGRELLQHAGKISHQMAIEKSSQEYEKYQAQQRQIEKENSLKELENDLKKLAN